MIIRFEAMQEGIELPTKGHEDDAGWDLRASEDGSLEPGEHGSIGTGLRMALPMGTCGLVFPRSGLAAKHGISVLNSPGLIDSGYRGECRVLLVNHGKETFIWQAGDRIAQLFPLVLPHIRMEWGDLDETKRGEGGFGSTGTV